MRKLLLMSGLLPCLLLVAGCPKKKDGEADAAAEADATAAAEPAATDAAAAPAAPAAKNAADVARFAAETKVEDDGAKPAAFAAARTSPKGGSVVATLKPGTDVTKVAEYQDCFLVTFADPKDASATLMGWIEKGSFTYVAPKDAGAKDAAAGDAGPVDAGAAAVDAGAPKCAANEERVTLSAAVSACKKKCKEDKECAKGPCSVASTTAGKAVKVCAAD
jgi:hypothetical protein